MSNYLAQNWLADNVNMFCNTFTFSLIFFCKTFSLLIAKIPFRIVKSIPNEGRSDRMKSYRGLTLIDTLYKQYATMRLGMDIEEGDFKIRMVLFDSIVRGRMYDSEV